MYEFTSRVRFSESDEAGLLKPLSMVNYLQDCSTLHSIDCGLGPDFLNIVKKAWLLCYWDIHIDSMPCEGDRIVIGTSPHKKNGLFAYRNFWIKDSADKYLVRADSIWFVFDMEKNRPSRIEDRMILPYGEFEDVLHITKAERRVRLPEKMSPAGEWKVCWQQIDTNHHLNNAQYIAIAYEALRDYLKTPLHIKRIRAEYKTAVKLGQKIEIYCGQSEEAYVLSLQGSSGEIYANVEIG